MSAKSPLETIGKFVIPVIFALLGLGMLIYSSKVLEENKIICFNEEFNEDEAVLVTMQDLEGGGIEEVVADYQKLSRKIKALTETQDILKDSVSFVTGDITAATSTKDSLTLDTLKRDLDKQIMDIIDEMNVLIDESNEKNKIIRSRMADINILKVANAHMVDSVTANQTNLFRYGGIGLLLMSILMILFVANVIDRRIAFILLPVLLLTTVAYIFMTWSSVDDSNDYKTSKDSIYDETKQRMIDIKESILLYKEQHEGKVPSSLDDLISYVKNDSTTSVYKKRDVPTGPLTKKHAFQLYSNIDISGLDSAAAQAVIDKWSDTTYIAYGDSTYNEFTAWKVGLIVRDTSYTPVLEKLFTGPAAKKRLSDFEFNADSMKYVAFTQEPFVYRQAAINISDNDSIAKYKYRFEVRLKTPMLIWDHDHKCEPRDVLILGSLLEDKVSGNW